MDFNKDEQIKILRIALECIAATDLEGADTKNYWENVSIRTCLATLAADTALAREALKGIGGV